MSHVQRWTILFGLAALLGCLSRSAPVVFHSLRPLSPREAAAGASALEVWPVRLPDSLQRPQLVVASGAGAAELSENHRWGNGLDKDLQRILVENLGALLGSEAVVAYPYGDRVKAPWRLEVDVQRLEGRPGGVLALRATWMLVPAAGGPARLLRRTALDEPVSGPGLEALVAAHDRILDRLSREIAEAVRTLDAKR